MTLCYVSDHWAQYVNGAGVARSSSHVHTLSFDTLQLEYDHLFLRAVLHVLRNKRWRNCLRISIFSWDDSLHIACCLFSLLLSHRLGIWLFMSEMPYGTLSSSMLWKVLYVMQRAETEEPETLGIARDLQSCIHTLRGTSLQTKF